MVKFDDESVSLQGNINNTGVCRGLEFIP